MYPPGALRIRPVSGRILLNCWLMQKIIDYFMPTPSITFNLIPNWRRLVAKLLGALALANGLPVQASAEPSEYEAKAAYVINFARYVNWPITELPEPSTPMHICVLGHDPFSDTLEHAVAGRISNGRPLVMRRLRQFGDAAGCQLVLIIQSEERNQAHWLPVLQGKPILTIGESGRFIRDGGIVNLIIVKGSVRFEVNIDAAARAGLKISSRMLGLAEVVHGKAEEAVK